MLRKYLPAAAALFALTAATTADARLAISSARPAANSTASKVTSVTMQFNEAVTPASVKSELIMTAMPGMSNHPPMKMQATSALGRDGKSLTLTLRRALVPGTYKVSWTAATRAGQSTSGHYSFTVK